jgi:hypothetical protein
MGSGKNEECQFLHPLNKGIRTAARRKVFPGIKPGHKLTLIYSSSTLRRPAVLGNGWLKGYEDGSVG